MIRKVVLELSEASVDFCKTRMKQLDLPFKTLEDYIAYLVLSDSLKIDESGDTQLLFELWDRTICKTHNRSWGDKMFLNYTPSKEESKHE